jgi:UDP-N-acetylmuramoylalanine--D-glutamate ligase
MYLVFGKGKSGKAAARLLRSRGYETLLVDDSTPDWERFLKKVSTVVVSPGIKPTHRVFTLSQKLGKELIGELELAYRFWKGKVIAITGTDGKSTTTAALYQILKSHRKDVFIGGNFGIPFSEIVLKNTFGVAVLEVSSFQGYTLKTFRPHLGIFLNFSPDHLDWHSSLEDYLRGKWNIFKNQTPEDVAFLNEIQEEIKNTPTSAVKYWFGGTSSDIVVTEALATFRGEKLFETQKVYLKGKHNLLNLAVAAAAARILGVPPEVIEREIYSFKGLPYRLQFVGRIKGVEIYNDSKSTTPNALKAALESFGGRIVLIFGGKDKGLDYFPLKSLFKKKVKFAIAYGENAHKLKETFGQAVPLKTAKTLTEAVCLALRKTDEGDILLFSPGAASFDQFSSYIERGQFFEQTLKECLKKLP